MRWIVHIVGARSGGIRDKARPSARQQLLQSHSDDSALPSTRSEHGFGPRRLTASMSSAAVRVGLGTRVVYDGELLEVAELHAGGPWRPIPVPGARSCQPAASRRVRRSGSPVIEIEGS
jgi:hypothetical protein